jgi:glycosyltransferase involved in cell wall biosynthesis
MTETTHANPEHYWFDLTHTMRWTGGIVGIVRAELEMGQKLRQLNPAIRFCYYSAGNAFVELSAAQLAELFDGEQLIESYLKFRQHHFNVPYGPAAKQIGFRQHRARYGDFLHDMQVGGLPRAARYKQGLIYLTSMLPLPRAKQAYYAARLAFAPIIWLDGMALRAMRKLKRMLGKGTGEQAAPAHPFGANAVFISAGWTESGKEAALARLKKQLPGLRIVYLVYDTILINDSTQMLYPQGGSDSFANYFRWASQHSDLLLFGGETAKQDALFHQNKNSYSTPPGVAVKFGDTISHFVHTPEEAKAILTRLGITRPFLLSVGSLDGRKNHDTIYRMQKVLLERNPNTPQMVFAGGYVAAEQMADSLKRDPAVQGQILHIRPSEEELDVLYKYCVLTLLPSLYEGWSLTLPESLQYGKLCLCSDVPPLREIGRTLVEYIEPWDTMGWAAAVEKYTHNPALLTAAEARIRAEWKPTSWQECAQMVWDAVHRHDFAAQTTPADAAPLWLDFSISYGWSGGVEGIIRAELEIAYRLKKRLPNLRFTVFDQNTTTFRDVTEEVTQWLMKYANPADSYRAAKGLEGGHGTRKAQDRYSATYRKLCEQTRSRRKRILQGAAMLLSLLPAAIGSRIFASIFSLLNLRRGKAVDGQPQYVLPALSGTPLADITHPFTPGSVLLSVGSYYSVPYFSAVRTLRAELGLKYVGMVYDFTPLIIPHTHDPQLEARYRRFFDDLSQESDMILYGGETAQKDGKHFQQKFGLPQPPSAAIKFGSKIEIAGAADAAFAQQRLHAMGVRKPFLLSVGTIQRRKNHETLYKAYVNWLERAENPDDVPQLVFVGRVGWLVDELLDMMSRDVRVHGRLLILQPDDDELDMLYRACEFTLLPSLYEGWSLALPESLQYGKFCLTSDTPPLREIGEGLVEFIHPLDTKGWSERMEYYHTHPQERTAWEARIKAGWQSRTWAECGDDIHAAVEAVLKLKLV